MDISDRLYQAFNIQYSQELTNHDLYEQLQNCSENLAWDGFAKYFAKSAKEELDHANAFRLFLIDRNRCPKISVRPAQDFELKEPLEFFGKAYEAEQSNTRNILALYELCHVEKDVDAKIFLRPYVEEQRKAERELLDVIVNLKRAQSNAAILLIQKELNSV